MNHLILTSAFAIGAALPAVAQQQTVVPNDFTGVSGSTYELRFPFSNGVSRMQAIYESWDVQITDRASIRRVGFRAEPRTSTGHAIQLSIYMGGTDLDTGTATTSFDGNYQNGTARTLVFGPSIVTLPNLDPATGQSEVWVTLDTPYTFRANENLVVEYVVTANNNANQAFNYFLDKGTFHSPVTPFGQGCQSSAGQVPTLTARAARIGSNLTYDLAQAPASSLVWLNLGVSPVNLDAGPFGAPGCTLLVMPTISIAGQGNTSGGARFSFSVPNDLTFYHLNLYGQGLIFDLFGNNLGFVFSNGVQVQLGAEAHIATVMAAGSPTASTGSLRRNNGVISLFEWQ